MSRRLFIALDLSIAVVEQIMAMEPELLDYLEEHYPDASVRWVNPENIHATLKFIGDVDDSIVDPLKSKLHEIVQPLFPFQLESVGLGAFPSPQKPRVLWTGIDQKGAEVLTLLHQILDRELGNMGFGPEPLPFKPHITLGRLRAEEPVDLSPLMERFSAHKFGTSTVKDLILYESQLHASGPRYTVLQRFALGGKR